MGNVSCVGKEEPEEEPGAAASHRRPPVEREVETLREDLDSLTTELATLQEEMTCLRTYNERLQEANVTLSTQNRQLWQSMEEAQEPWSALDVVEEHYKMVERHRAHVKSGQLVVLPAGSENAPDEAAGMPGTGASSGGASGDARGSAGGVHEGCAMTASSTPVKFRSGPGSTEITPESRKTRTGSGTMVRSLSPNSPAPHRGGSSSIWARQLDKAMEASDSRRYTA
eukprot:TRINITY_DN3624_c0_g1_i1.p1 TRINITY_DN3624_c0_g1~~TRINITY_DN3624_c0_g1_i1.p1  ORF type:complete len:254 (+),score=49.12 TRINITY_DN3624_c0_g1_i1:82-762(+)